MIYAIQLYLLTCLLFLASKDAIGYLWKGADNAWSKVRVKRWHFDGAALYFLSIVPCVFIYHEKYWLVFIYSLLLRLSFFDLAFNHWANLPATSLGSTAFFDKIFAKIFGQHGALYKSFAFMLILAGVNIYFEIKHIQ